MNSQQSVKRYWDGRRKANEIPYIQANLFLTESKKEVIVMPDNYDSKLNAEVRQDVMLTFIPEKGSLQIVGGAYRFIFKKKEIYVPSSQCTINREVNIIKIPEWLCQKKGLA